MKTFFFILGLFAMSTSFANEALLSDEAKARRDEIAPLFDLEPRFTAQQKTNMLFEAFPDFPARAKATLSDRAIALIVVAYNQNIDFERRIRTEQEAELLSICAALEADAEPRSVVGHYWDAQLSANDKRETRSQRLLSSLPIQDLVFLEENYFSDFPAHMIMTSDMGVARLTRQLSVEFPEDVKPLILSECKSVRRDYGKPFIWVPPVSTTDGAFTTYENGYFTRGE